MRIIIDVQPVYDNEIRFFDACKATAKKLEELGQKALDDGDCEQFDQTDHQIIDSSDGDDEVIGSICIMQ